MFLIRDDIKKLMKDKKKLNSNSLGWGGRGVKIEASFVLYISLLVSIFPKLS